MQVGQAAARDEDIMKKFEYEKWFHPDVSYTSPPTLKLFATMFYSQPIQRRPVRYRNTLL
jgi:hypothetical protein